MRSAPARFVERFGALKEVGLREKDNGNKNGKHRGGEKVGLVNKLIAEVLEKSGGGGECGNRTHDPVRGDGFQDRVLVHAGHSPGHQTRSAVRLFARPKAFRCSDVRMKSKRRSTVRPFDGS